MAIAELKPLLRSYREADGEQFPSRALQFTGQSDVCKHYKEAK
jgi:hypothetical protein